MLRVFIAKIFVKIPCKRSKIGVWVVVKVGCKSLIVGRLWAFQGIKKGHTHCRCNPLSFLQPKSIFHVLIFRAFVMFVPFVRTHPVSIQQAIGVAMYRPTFPFTFLIDKVDKFTDGLFVLTIDNGRFPVHNTR